MLTEESSPARMNSKSSAGDAFHYDDMRQACGKELCMRQYVGDSFLQTKFVILFLDTFPSLHARRTSTAALTSQKISVCCLQNAGPFTIEKVL